MLSPFPIVLYIIRRSHLDTPKSARSPYSSVGVKRSHPDPTPQDMGKQNYSMNYSLESEENTEQYIPREETVRGLYNKLKENKYIQVCSRLNS
jgi:hypothetical protein